MKLAILALAALLVVSSVSAGAEIVPTPSSDDPRLQTVSFEPGQTIRLLLFPDSSLKLVLERNEAIERVVVSDSGAYRAAVLDPADTIEVTPLTRDAIAELVVTTSVRQYSFTLQTRSGGPAAYIVRIVPPSNIGTSPPPAQASSPTPGATLVHYRLSGDKVLRPDSIFDDGERTYIAWQKDKALPAVFGTGPNGAEEIVAGYMREGSFVIDRIYPQLVFRFDRAIAMARRSPEKKP